MSCSNTIYLQFNKLMSVFTVAQAFKFLLNEPFSAILFLSGSVDISLDTLKVTEFYFNEFFQLLFNSIHL